MTEPSLGLTAELGVPPLFFRSADHLRLEGCVAGLLRDGRSLALSSTNEAALDHYSRMLIARLRESAPHSPPELYFPADTTAMLNRFNEAVAAMSMEQAMQTGAPSATARTWVVHDAGALANHEVQLLARLVQNFPGAQVRVVLLLGPGSQSRKTFETMDRRLLRWDIEAPTPEQAQAMLAQGREDGCEGAVQALLKKLEAPAPGSAADADPAGVDPLGFQSRDAGVLASGAAADVFKFAAERDDDPQGRNAGKGRGRGKHKAKAERSPRTLGSRLRALLRWLFILVALSVLSLGVTAWLHPDVFSLDRLAMAKRWAMTLAAPAAPAVPVDATPSAPAEAAAASNAPAVPAEPAPPQPSAAVATPPASQEASANATTPLSTAAASPAPSAVATAQATTPEPAEVEPPAEALAGQAWAQAMPANAWVVQHAAMPAYQTALNWQKSQALLSDARIVALYRPNDKLAYFAVVSGPFASRALATTSAARKGMPAQPWVRTARSLREQFNSGPNAAYVPRFQETR